MADDNRKNVDIEKELSVGKFTMQQLRTLGFQFGGMVAGWFGGKAVGKTNFKNTVGKWVTNRSSTPATAELLEHNIKSAEKFYIPILGMAVGSIIGGIASLYEHWAKVERERLTVEEINADVASVMEKRVQFESTLDTQHAIVKNILAQQKTAPQLKPEKMRTAIKDIIMQQRNAPENKQDKLTAERETAANTEATRA